MGAPDREVTGLQDGLKAILAKVQALEAETAKLAQENLLLDQYIVNLAHKA